MRHWGWHSSFRRYLTHDCTYSGTLARPGRRREVGARLMVWDGGDVICLQVLLWWRVLDVRRYRGHVARRAA
jgi:hypothetical protein